MRRTEFPIVYGRRFGAADAGPYRSEEACVGANVQGFLSGLPNGLKAGDRGIATPGRRDAGRKE